MNDDKQETLVCISGHNSKLTIFNVENEELGRTKFRRKKIYKLS